MASPTPSRLRARERILFSLVLIRNLIVPAFGCPLTDLDVPQILELDVPQIPKLVLQDSKKPRESGECKRQQDRLTKCEQILEHSGSGASVFK